MKDAGANPGSLAISTSRGNDVENMYVTQEAREDGMRGVGFTTRWHTFLYLQ